MNNNLIALNSTGTVYPPGSTIPFPTKYPQSFTTDSQVDVSYTSSNTDVATVATTGTYPNQILTITTYTNGDSMITGVFEGWVKESIIPSDNPNVVINPDQTGVPDGYKDVTVTVKYYISVTGYFNSGGTNPIYPDPNPDGLIEVEELQRTTNLPEDGFFPVISNRNVAKKVPLTRLVDAQLMNNLNVQFSEYRAQSISINDTLNSILRSNQSLTARLTAQNIKHQNAQSLIEKKVKTFDKWDGSASATITGTGVKDNPYTVTKCSDWVKLVSVLATYAGSELYIKVTENLDFNNQSIPEMYVSGSLLKLMSIDFGFKELRNINQESGSIIVVNLPSASVTISSLILNNIDLSDTSNVAPFVFLVEPVLTLKGIEVKNSTFTCTDAGNTNYVSSIAVIRSNNIVSGTHTIENCNSVDNFISSTVVKTSTILSALLSGKVIMQNNYSKSSILITKDNNVYSFAGIASLEFKENNTALQSFFVNNVSSTIFRGQANYACGTIALKGATGWADSWYGNYIVTNKAVTAYYSGTDVKRSNISRNQMILNNQVVGDSVYKFTDGACLDLTSDLEYALLFVDFSNANHKDSIVIGSNTYEYPHNGVNTFNISYSRGSFSILQSVTEEMSAAIQQLLSNFNKYQTLSVWDGTTYTEPTVGSGTDQSPYQIDSAAVLAYLLGKRSTSAVAIMTVDVSLDNKAIQFDSNASRTLSIDLNNHYLESFANPTGGFMNGDNVKGISLNLRNGVLSTDGVKQTLFDVNSIVMTNIKMSVRGVFNGEINLISVVGNSNLTDVTVLGDVSAQSFGILYAPNSITLNIDTLRIALDIDVVNNVLLLQNSLGQSNLNNVFWTGYVNRQSDGTVALLKSDSAKLVGCEIAVNLETVSTGTVENEVTSFVIGNLSNVELLLCYNNSKWVCGNSDTIAEFAINKTGNTRMALCKSMLKLTTDSSQVFRLGLIKQPTSPSTVLSFSEIDAFALPQSNPFNANGVLSLGEVNQSKVINLTSASTLVQEIAGVMYMTVSFSPAGNIVIPFAKRPMLNEFTLFIRSSLASKAFTFSIEGVQQTIYDSSQTTTPPTTGYNAYLKYRFWKIPGKENTWCYTQTGA